MKSLLAAAVLAMVLGVAAAGERAAPPPPQTKCPISGRPIDGSNFANVDGFRIYTAGPAETDQVYKNPGKAFAALAKNREAAVPLVWVCPSMRNPVSPAYPFVQQGGKRIYYCCAPCQPQIKKNFKAAADAMKKLAEQGQ